jgi:hypothetical protein
VTVERLDLVQSASGKTALQKVDGGDGVLPAPPPELNSYTAAAELAANYHLPTAEVLTALRGAYGAGTEIPEYHLAALGQQIEVQRAQYEEHFEDIDVAIALIKSEGFDRSERAGVPVYTARISFAKEREPLYLSARDTPDVAHALASSFHYEGYNFDSAPEAEFLKWTLAQLRSGAHQIEGVWFTGGLTDPAKTDLYAEYLGDDGRWHRYTPDFVLRRADGKHLVVEIKRDSYSPDIQSDLARLGRGEAALTLEGRKAVALKQWEGLNPDKLAYHLMFADTGLKPEGYRQVRDFIAGL